MDFLEFPKIHRLSRQVIVTEKIDGTNAQVAIFEEPELTPESKDLALAKIDGRYLFAGSRSRYLQSGDDNFGFAAWVLAHREELAELGPGRHFGEWWGSGIQRGYGLTKGDKRFSLFNVARWADDRDQAKYPAARPACCGVVPVLYTGMFDDFMGHVDDIMENLKESGSWVAKGFMQPEGIVVFHTQSGLSFKKTLTKDEEHKGQHARP